jgi:hypothetical protein
LNSKLHENNVNIFFKFTNITLTIYIFLWPV